MAIASTLVTIYVQLAFVLLFPALVAIGCTAFWRSQLKRPIVFFLVSCIALYAIYVLLMMFFGSTSSFLITRSDASEAGRATFGNSFIGQRWKPLVIFGLLAVPTVLLLLRSLSRVAD
jgi:hypothetical protein